MSRNFNTGRYSSSSQPEPVINMETGEVQFPDWFESIITKTNEQRTQILNSLVQEIIENHQAQPHNLPALRYQALCGVPAVRLLEPPPLPIDSDSIPHIDSLPPQLYEKEIAKFERRLADVLIHTIPGAKPFCISPNPPKIVQKDRKHSYILEEAHRVQSLMPIPAKKLMRTVESPEFILPVTDARIAREIIHKPFPRQDPGEILEQQLERLREHILTLKQGAAQLRGRLSTLKDSLGDFAVSAFTPDPVLVVRVGEVAGYYVEIYRWDL